MTWFANNIYTLYSPELLSEFGETFPGCVYHVTTLSTHTWFNDTIRHGLPDGGLLVVRPIGAFDEFTSDWYDENFLNWESIEYRKWSNITFGQTILTAEEASNHNPPDRFLGYLKHISEEYTTQVFYYSCFMWGGDIESEYSFLYDNGDEQVLLFTGSRDSQPLISLYTEKEILHEQPFDILQRNLQKLGLRLPTAYFALHTRGFPWNEYHVG
jgi:hypothetical protein